MATISHTISAPAPVSAPINPYLRNGADLIQKSTFTTPPPPTPDFLVEFPRAHVMLVSINRPKAMNSLTYAAQWDADELFLWFDKEPSLRVAVLTGEGKAFCAGQDLTEQKEVTKWRHRQAQGEVVPELDRRFQTLTPNGFMGVSRREGKKPIIAAVNGYALGGGFETCLGCDIILASPKAVFGLPEASRGLYAAAGGLSRLVRIAGMTIASEIALTGRSITAEEAVKFHIANRISATPFSLLDEALDMASQIASMSPDSIIITRAGLRQSWEDGSVERATQTTERLYDDKYKMSENYAIGLKAFAERKKPIWVNSKL